MSSVLIVDDLVSIHEMLESVIHPTGLHSAFASDGSEALEKYKAERFDLVLADVDMKPMDGITLLKSLKLYDPAAVIIIMTAYASTDSAVQALKYGAFDYIQKPFKVDELIAIIKRGLEYRQFQLESAAQSSVPAVKPSDLESRIVGKSAAIKRLLQQVKKLSSVRTPVLLTGESGTGCKTVAEVLHAISNPQDAPLIRIDCALSSESNFREGLLGENGAGGEWVHKARGGTLFLQHLQSLPTAMQKELVSVLRNTSHGFRLICTASEDIEKLMDEGRFNDELFYRVATLPITLPPLRDRLDDLPLLVKHFSARATNPNFDPALVEFTPDAMTVLHAYHWPGNLAELEQVVIKIVSTTDTRVITSQQLPLRLRELKSWPTLVEYLDGQQKQYIDQVLNACKGDKSKAGKILGIDPSKLS